MRPVDRSTDLLANANFGPLSQPRQKLHQDANISEPEKQIADKQLSALVL